VTQITFYFFWFLFFFERETKTSSHIKGREHSSLLAAVILADALHGRCVIGIVGVGICENREYTAIPRLEVREGGSLGRPCGILHLLICEWWRWRLGCLGLLGNDAKGGSVPLGLGCVLEDLPVVAVVVVGDL